MRPLCLLACILFWVPFAAAQESASFKLNENTYNSGGNPADGSTPASASFRISQDAIGEPAKHQTAGVWGAENVNL